MNWYDEMRKNGDRMDKYSIDYTLLNNKLSSPKIYKLASVQGKIEKVAFDVVRFMDGTEEIDKLWRIHKGDDGNEYIMAMYDDSPTETVKNAWSAAINKNASHMTVFYKGEPITKLAAADVGATPTELSALCNQLPSKLAAERELVGALLSDLSESERDALKERYPELLAK